MSSENSSEIKEFWNNNPVGSNFIAYEESILFYKKYDEFRYSTEGHILKELDLINFQNKTVLEIGLGQGADSMQIIDRGAKYYGIDITEESVKRVKERFQLFGKSYKEVQPAMAEEIPYPDSTFDIIYSHGVIHHSPNIEKIVSEIYRVLKPGGQAVIMLYHKNSFNYFVSISVFRRLGLLLLVPFPFLSKLVSKLLDEPIGDPAAINTFLICKAAREKGIKVLLSGMGADEIFFGYRRQKATLIAKKFKLLPFALRKIITGSVKLLPVKMFGRGIKTNRWAKRFLSFASMPTEEAYMKSYSYYTESELMSLFKNDVSHEYYCLRQEHQQHFNKSYDSDEINRICYTDINMFMQGLNLTYTDRASMAASVEVRVPFIDKEVISLAMKITGNLKYKKGQSKFILKKVAEKFLPNKIIYRPKASFGAPIRSWISGDLVPLVNDLLSQNNIEKRGFFNYKYVEEIINNDRNGTEDNAYRIYQLLVVELWCRQYVD